ncbi:MAG: AMP-binding protein, partial [Ferrovibrio sp.]
MTTIYDRDLDKNRANFEALSPLSFLRRTAEVFPDRLAVIHGKLRYSYAELYERCRRLASALEKRGIKAGDTVAIIAPNTPAHLEAHFGIPVTGAVINAINTRLDAAAIAFILEHGEAKILFTDREYSAVVKQAVHMSSNKPLIIDIDDHLCSTGELFGEMEYEAFLQT